MLNSIARVGKNKTTTNINILRYHSEQILKAHFHVPSRASTGLCLRQIYIGGQNWVPDPNGRSPLTQSSFS